MKLVVDACILIDLQNGKLLERFFKLDAEISVSDAQLFELGEKDDTLAELMSSFNIKNISFNDQEIKEADELYKELKQLSIYDILAFIGARKLGAILLTGDKDLRRLSISNEIECHGVLWVLDRLIGDDIITESYASSALRDICNSNSFLPKAEVVKRLTKWQDIGG